MHALPASVLAVPNEPVWLLTGDRLGEIAQQRALAQALGLPFREVQVARLAAAGGKGEFDFDALRPPWPTLVISFGQTLRAAVELRRRAGASLRIVQLGRPRGVDWSSLDLIVPMPQDAIPGGHNVLPLRMPLNPAPAMPAAPLLDRVRAQAWPRPWTLLVMGGVTRQYRFDARVAQALLDDATRRVQARGGSLLVSSSPRTPADVLATLAAPLRVPGECYVFRRRDPGNPLAAYLHEADEIIVSGDSPSMLAECWRSAKPVLVQPLRCTPRYRLKQLSRRWVPDAWLRSGRVGAALDVNAWLRGLEAQGHVGVLGRSEARLRYDSVGDDDLARLCTRIRRLLEPGAPPALLPTPAGSVRIAPA